MSCTRGGDLAGGADRDRRDVEHQAVVVEERARPDADARPVLQVERRADVDAVAAFGEQLAQEAIAQVLLGERAAVVALEDLLRAFEVRGEVIVVGDVQLAAQHSLLHLAHASLPASRMAFDSPRTRRAAQPCARAMLPAR
jgi:hypothetical protein